MKAGMKLIIAATLGLFVLCPEALAASDSNLVAHWQFDEGSGTVAYDSAGNNDGTIYGAQWTSGIIGGALDFDGINDYVEVPDNESQQIKTNQLTVMAWIKLDEDIGNRQRRLICKQEPSGIYWTLWALAVCGKGYSGCTGNQVVFNDSNGSTFSVCLSPTNLALHQWHHIAVTDTAGAIRIYLDGQLDHSCDNGYGIPSNINAPILIGCTNLPALFFKDMVDDVMIFDRALSAEEIWVQYVKSQPLEGLISRWELDEGSGTTAYDSVGSNHGIIHGAQWTTGIIGGALNFDGINDYVEVPDNESQQIKTNQLAVMAWIKLDEDIGNIQRRLICKQQTSGICWGLAVCGKGHYGCTGNQVLFFDSDGQTTWYNCLSTTNLALHKWYHIAVTDAAGAIRIYLDGQLDHSCDNGYGIPSNINAPILIGCTNPPQLFFKNMVDDAMIFDRALSDEEIQQIYQEVVPPEIPATYYVDGINGNDLNDGLSLETAFATVQKGINTAKDGDTVLVYPAVYSEAVDFAGKAIMVQGVATTAGIPVLENPGDFAVSFYNGEEPNSILKNFVIKNSFMAVFIASSSPALSNLTVVDNDYGIKAYVGSEPDISNCIFWNNTDADLDGCQAQYSWVQDTKPQPLEGLISRWALDEGSGTIAHDSVGNNHGTIYGAQWTTGIIGGALDFAGNGERVQVPDDDSLTPANQITICFWVYNRGGSVPAIYKYASCPGEPASPGNSRAYGMALYEDGVSMAIYSAVNTYGQITSNNPVSLNKWHHVAGTFNKGQAALYVDGHPKISDTLTVSSIMNDAQPLTIGGAWEYCGTDSFEGKLNGLVDDVRIYNRALSAEDIQQLFDGGLTDNPLFADPANGDYHLLSRRGRYWPQHDVWVLDKVTSPCIDGGDPAVDPSGEPMPNGGRIDMGAYGGTPFASMSEWPITTDVNHDGVADFADLATFCNEWLSTLPWAE